MSVVVPKYILPEYSQEIRTQIEQLMVQVITRYRENTPIVGNCDNIKRSVAKFLSVPQLVGTIEILIKEIDRLNTTNTEK